MNRFESDYGTTIREASWLLRAVGSDRLKLHLDTVHLNIEEDDIGKAIESAGSAVCHVHVADNNRWYPGHAHYNFTETLTALHRVEMCIRDRFGTESGWYEQGFPGLRHHRDL